MLKLIELDKTKKVRISFEEESELIIHNYDKLETNLDTSTKSINESRSFTLELLLPYHASNYATLGAKYTPSTDNSLHLEVRYLTTNAESYENTLALNKRTVFKGLSKEYVETVLKTSVEYLQNNSSPSGKIAFDTAACCELGSSPLIFKIATKIVLQLLLNECYPVSEDVVKSICEKHLRERSDT